MRKLPAILMFLTVVLLTVVAVNIVNPSDKTPHHTAGTSTVLNSSVQNPNCLHPGYGEFNAGSIELKEGKIKARVGEVVEVKGTITGKGYRVGESGKPGRACYYDGKVALRDYLGPNVSKSSWSYMSEKLKTVNGTMRVIVRPSIVYLSPNGTIDFRVKIVPEKKGVYYLYMVAFGEKGWKSWGFVEVDVN